MGDSDMEWLLSEGEGRGTRGRGLSSPPGLQDDCEAEQCILVWNHSTNKII